MLTCVKERVCIFEDGYGVSRSSDYIIYSVEAEMIDKVVAEYGRGMFRHPVSNESHSNAR